MSIVRIGLAETKDFAEGYDAIFGKKAAAPENTKSESENDVGKEPAKTEQKPTVPAK